MPQACSVQCTADDLASTDEVKVYKDEGDDEKRSSEVLSEEKFGLVTETEDVRYVTLGLHPIFFDSCQCQLST